MKAVFLSAFLVLFVLAPSAWAGVVFHDAVAVRGNPVMLRAETKGMLFKKGGLVVEFYQDQRGMGRTLSGGDGMAYLEFVPEDAGLYRITVKSGDDVDTGYVLSVEEGGGVVFIDVVGSLYEGPFSASPRPGSSEAVKEIADRFPLAYLSTLFPGRGPMGKWLEENGFPPAPVIDWRNGRVFDEVAGKGLKTRAVVGSPEVVASATAHKPQAFSFQDVEGARRVKDWDEIAESLR